MYCVTAGAARCALAAVVIILPMAARTETKWQCPMASDYADIGKSQKLQVLARDRGDGVEGAVLAVTNRVAVDADGSPRAYHPYDPDGKKYAIDTMCSGSTHVFLDGEEISCFKKKGESKEAHQRRLSHYYRTFAAARDRNGGWKSADSGFDPENEPVYKPGGPAP